MEATFSRNIFIANRVEGSDNGLWGGYSFDSRDASATVRRQSDRHRDRAWTEESDRRQHVHGDSVAVSLWANPIEPSDWGYPQAIATRRAATTGSCDNGSPAIGSACAWRPPATSASWATARPASTACSCGATTARRSLSAIRPRLLLHPTARRPRRWRLARPSRPTRRPRPQRDHRRRVGAV